ncbi:MAG: hypothetical protein IPM06_17615 [Rhizobiales bacterium]|nr:hypothetical protein [Hyphomicrobiales bacterium]
MGEKTKRKHLNDYSHAHRDIELTEAAINILERVSGAQTVVKALKRKQQVHLRRLDAAAEKLGAPYGA